jgi:hypothetical protein
MDEAPFFPFDSPWWRSDPPGVRGSIASASHPAAGRNPDARVLPQPACGLPSRGLRLADEAADGGA